MSPTDSPPIDLDNLSNAELKGLVVKQWEQIAELNDVGVKQWEQIAELNRVVAALRDEIARLKGGPPRPTIKPSGMERATDPTPPPDAGAKPRRGPTRTKLTIHEERIIEVVPPPGARFKGYASYVVQDLVIRPHVIEFRRQRWRAADGRMVTAPLPQGIVGHFGPQLRRLVLTAYHQGQATMPRLLTLLRAIGISISKREVVRLLNAGQERFRNEARGVLRAGLTNSPFVTVDDTGARHQARNGYTTQLGNAHFTAFITTAAKSRRNFLEVLRAGHTDYVINDEALVYMRERSLAAHVIARLLAHRKRRFVDHAAWTAHLEQLGITALKVSPDPVLIATEGALWGSVKAHGFLPNAVIVSDDAGQFNVGEHALCWVHAERLVHKLDTFTPGHRAAQEKVRAAIWRLYGELKAYRGAPSGERKAALAAEFDRIFTGRTGFVTLDRLLARLHANKAELLKVLERPEIPLHTNGSENDIRCQVTRRKVSAGTRSDVGRDCRDAFLALAKTCAKLGITFWDYLGDRLAIAGCPTIAPLPELVLARARPP